MSRNGKVIVAMSGGVDSSVAACMLKEQGYDCIGVFMRVGAHADEPSECAVTSGTPDASARDARPRSGAPAARPAPPRRLKHGCCSATDAADARTVAGRLGIPFYALNLEREFDGIMDYFVDEYVQGRTPNPCVMCNIHIKFGRLLRYADMMDAPLVATGHYARIVVYDGRARLARSFNAAKDQTYVLFGMRRDNLHRCRFPLGEVIDKATVRSIAADLGLAVHDKPDSQEICFVPNNDYRELLRRRRPDALRPGPIRHVDGRTLGSHEGVAAYTIGQRRGLRLATGSPVYITGLDAGSNTVTIGPREALLSQGLTARDVIWHADPPDDWTAAQVQIRHMHRAADGRVRALPGGGALRDGRALPDGGAEAVFDEPVSAVTPGQAAVFYQDGLILGGGWIV